MLGPTPKGLPPTIAGIRGTLLTTSRKHMNAGCGAYRSVIKGQSQKSMGSGALKGLFHRFWRKPVDSTTLHLQASCAHEGSGFADTSVGPLLNSLAAPSLGDAGTGVRI